jgi:hypothetical protein
LPLPKIAEAILPKMLMIYFLLLTPVTVVVHVVCDSSATVGRPPCGVSLSTTSR